MKENVELTWCAGGSPISVRSSDRGESKLLFRVMQNRPERDNESCWSKTGERGYWNG